MLQVPLSQRRFARTLFPCRIVRTLSTLGALGVFGVVGFDHLPGPGATGSDHLPAPSSGSAIESLPGSSVTFTLRIENVSTPATLKTTSGASLPAPVSPGVWAAHSIEGPLFTSGEPAPDEGLERLAEEGNPVVLAASVERASGILSSGILAAMSGGMQLAPLSPGEAFEVSFTVDVPRCAVSSWTGRRGAVNAPRLSFAVMFAQSNDLFYAPDEEGIPLFSRFCRPLTGDVTSRLQLWDAGTEVNQEPGVGADQAPRQPAPDTGAAEQRPVAEVQDGFSYPEVSAVLRVTLAASET